METRRLSSVSKILFESFYDYHVGTKKSRRNAGKVAHLVLTNWVDFWDAVYYIDRRRFEIYRVGMPTFRNGRNITLQTVIPGHLPSLGATGRRRVYIQDITQQIIDKRKNNQINPVEWQEYASLSMVQLSSQAKQCDDFTPSRRVSGRAPEMPIGSADVPNLCDFMNQNGPHATKTQKCFCG